MPNLVVLAARDHQPERLERPLPQEFAESRNVMFGRFFSVQT